MNKISARLAGDLSPALAGWIDEVCDRFEASWRSGERPGLEDYCGSVAQAEQALLLRYLVPLEIECRRRQGEQPRVEEYRQAFPQLDEAWLANVLAAPVADPPGQPASPDSTGTFVPNQPAAFSQPPGLPGAAAIPAPIPVVPGYALLAEIGRGGMGVVYKARHLGLGRIVALKMILAGGHSREAELARFRTEAEAIARLQHPNIVTIHEVGEHEGRPFLSLEFCSGGSLDQKLNGTPLLPLAAAHLVQNLAQAVHALHQAQVLHRDLKPANVLLTADGTPKISDFGLAKMLDSAGQTQTGAILGSPSYMAPEQACGQGKQLTAAADIYALGAILYELLTGRPPFKAPTVLNTLHQVVTNEPVPPSRLQSKTPRDLETICLKCLHKEPQKRYATAAALADDLSRFQRGEAITARPASWLERSQRWMRRNRALAAALAAVLLLLTLGTPLACVQWMWESKARALAEEAATDARQEQADAEKAAQELEQTNTQLEKAIAARSVREQELLTSTARGLLRSLATEPREWQEEPFSAPEIEALWELACTPEEKLRLHFVAEAFRDPALSRQLKDRTVVALQAAVGLDEERRRQVEGIVVRALQGPETSSPQQRNAALILDRMGVRDRGLVRKAAEILIGFLSKTESPHEVRELAEGIASLAGRLEPDERTELGEPVAIKLLESFLKAEYPDTKIPLAHALSAVTACLKPKEASQICGQAVAKLWPEDGKAEGSSPYYLIRNLEPLVLRLEPEEAVPHLVRAMSQMDMNYRPQLVEAFFAVMDRLEPGEAVDACTQILTSLRNSRVYHDLKMALPEIAARLQPDEAAALATDLSGRLAQATDFPVVAGLAQMLAAVSDRLEPGQASRIRGPVVPSICRAYLHDRQWQMEAVMPAVAGQLEPSEAAAAAAVFALALMQGKGKQQAATAGLKMVVPRMDANQAVNLLLPVFPATTEAAALHHLAEALANAADRLDPKSKGRPRVAEECRQIAIRLSETLRQATDPDDLAHLAGALAAVAGPMEPAQAAALCAQAVPPLLQALPTITKSNTLELLGESLVVLAARMEPRESASMCDQAVRLFQLALRQKWGEWGGQEVARGLVAVAGRFEPVQAVAILSQAMVGTDDQQPLGVLGDGLRNRAVRMTPEEAAAAIACLTQAMSRTESPLALSELEQVREALGARLELRKAGLLGPPPAWSFRSAGLKEVCPRAARSEPQDAFALLSRNQAGWGRLDGYRMEMREVLGCEPDGTFLRRNYALIGAVGTAIAPPARLFAPVLLEPALQPLPPPLPVPVLVELLKQPLCVSANREVVLEQLARHYQRPFADQWDFVHFAQEQKLGLDFTTPPRRPGGLDAPR